MNDREPFIYIKQMYMKGFFDLEENCKEKIISEDYWDFIIPLYRDEELKEVNPENVCIQEMDFGYKSVSVDRRILLPLSFREYWYSTIPKCYALLDMQPLDAAGIITLQNYPTLQLKGKGVLIVCFAIWMGRHGLWESGIRRFRQEEHHRGFIMERNIRKK